MRTAVSREAHRQRDAAVTHSRMRSVNAPTVMALVVLLALLAPTPASAARPLDTEDTGTVPPGNAELELSGDVLRAPDTTAWSTKGVLSFGVVPRLEARFESAVLVLAPDRDANRAGISDSLVGFKYRLLDETETRPAVLSGLTLRLPTGDDERGLGVPGVDVGLLLVVSKAFGPVVVTGNVGHVFVTRDRALDTWLVTGSIEYRVASHWLLVGEMVGGVGGSRVRDSLIVRGGAVYAITNSVRFDAAVAAGMRRGGPDVLVTVGVTIGLF